MDSGEHSNTTEFSCMGVHRGDMKPSPIFCNYIAYLHIKNEEESRCGGVLVGDNFVLTAAHCNGRSISVTLGAHNITKQEKTQQVILVKRAILHPDYNERKSSYDIMLLQLKKSIKQTYAVKPLQLPSGKDLPSPGDNCIVAGWGQVTKKGPCSDTLQEVELTLRKDVKCKKRFNHYNKNIQLCVGNPRENKASLQGDSGGQLLCKNEIQGIVSYGSEDGEPPRVFTKVASFHPWIRETMKSLQLQDPDSSLELIQDYTARRELLPPSRQCDKCLSAEGRPVLLFIL